MILNSGGLDQAALGYDRQLRSVAFSILLLHGRPVPCAVCEAWLRSQLLLHSLRNRAASATAVAQPCAVYHDFEESVLWSF